MERIVRAWHIGEYGEIYGASSEEDVRNYFRKLVGNKEAEECFESEFLELSSEELDAVKDFNDDGEIRQVSFRSLALESVEWPTQISTTYY